MSATKLTYGYLIYHIANSKQAGIKKLKKLLLQDIQTLITFKQRVPGSYMLLERKLSLIRSYRPTITWEEFKAFAVECYILIRQSIERSF